MTEKANCLGMKDFLFFFFFFNHTSYFSGVCPWAETGTSNSKAIVWQSSSATAVLGSLRINMSAQHDRHYPTCWWSFWGQFSKAFMGHCQGPFCFYLKGVISEKVPTSDPLLRSQLPSPGNNPVNCVNGPLLLEAYLQCAARIPWYTGFSEAVQTTHNIMRLEVTFTR